ncbi:MAG: malectin domain-containing carbohydrate-binding protein, partial [Saprospiraceae bacterium]|nr:malectin domain-containing carbohydrate-binding protein [Saprospiraceae bacterium]
SASPPWQELAVNIGSHCYFMDDTRNDDLWLPDQPYRAGSFGYIGGEKLITRRDIIGTDRNIRNTDLDPLFQTQHRNFTGYRIDAPDGRYELTLLLADLDGNSDHVFDIVCNDRVLMQHLNIRDRYGAFQAVEKSFVIEVKGGQGLQITMPAHQGINGLCGLRLYRFP